MDNAQFQFTAFVENLNSRTRGFISGAHLYFPTTTELVQATLNIIGVDGLRNEEIIVTDYGLKGRTAFSLYRFDDRDKMAIAWLLFCGAYLLAGSIASAFGFRYFPSVRYVSLNTVTLSFQFVYFGMCIMPVVLNAAEERKWKAIHSKM